jgi:hypothetical protein
MISLPCTMFLCTAFAHECILSYIETLVIGVILLKRNKIVLEVSSIVLLCTLAMAVFGTTLALRQSSKSVPNSASIKGVGVGIYWDSACANQTSSINWGMLESGTNKTVTIYVRNEGNTFVTLSKTLQNWNPIIASNYVTLNWDYSGQTLSVNQVARVNLTLAVSSTVSGITNFTFDITITATG